MLALSLLGACEPAPPKPPAPVPTLPLVQPLLEPWSFLQNGRPDIARVRLRKLVPGDEWTAQSAFLMGLTYHAEDRYGKALPWFEIACAADDVYPPASHFRGWALYWLGRPADARAAFEQHLLLTPDEGDSHFGIALIDIEAAQWNEAESRLLRAIELQHSDPDRVDGVAKSKARLAEVIEQRDHDLERAQALLAEALTLDTDLYEAGFRRARLLRQLGRMHEAQTQESESEAIRLRVAP